MRNAIILAGKIICHRFFFFQRCGTSRNSRECGYRIGGADVLLVADGAAESKPNIKRELHMYSDKVLR